MPSRLPDHLPHAVIQRADFAEACARRDIGAVFRLARKWAGFTNSHLARRCEMGVSQVADYASGRTTATAVAIFERVSDGLHVPGRMLLLGPRSWERQPLPFDTPQTRTDEEGSTAKRRQFLAGAAVGAAAILPTSANGATARKVTDGDIAAIDFAAASIRSLDNQFGGDSAHALALSYLTSHVMPLVDQGDYTAATGRKLFRCAAELSQLTAWTGYDSAHAGDIGVYFRHALELSAAANETAYGGEILAALSHQAIHAGQPSKALQYAQASKDIGIRTHTPALHTEAAILEANAFALIGDRRQCALKMSEAESAFALASDANTPSWLGYLDSVYIAARFAHIFRDLGDFDKAREFAGQADALNVEFHRTRTLNLTVLATTYTQSEPDRACAIGSDLIADAHNLKSRRALTYLCRLRDDLTARHPGNTAVQSFAEELSEMAGSL